MLTPEEKAVFELRKQIALAQLGAFIDVASAWRGRYEDDDRPVGIGWIINLIPQIEETYGPEPIRRGWLCRDGTNTPSLGWYLDRAFHLCAIDANWKGKGLVEITRRDFRDTARRNGVVLPSRHATLYLDEDREREEEERAYKEWLTHRKRSAG
jgi:hypothetical protein